MELKHVDSLQSVKPREIWTLAIGLVSLRDRTTQSPVVNDWGCGSHLNMCPTWEQGTISRVPPHIHVLKLGRGRWPLLSSV